MGHGRTQKIQKWIRVIGPSHKLSMANAVRYAAVKLG